MSQVYFIDGQALGPHILDSDPLTNTWKPKKYALEHLHNQVLPPNWISNTTSGSGTISQMLMMVIANNWCNITSGNTFTLTPPSTIVADTVEVWLDTDTPASFSINGGTFSLYL